MQELDFGLPQKKQIIGVLEYACTALEITKTQQEEAENRYNAVGNWLNESSAFLLSNSSIYSQGSIRIGTTVKPLQRNEFDVDLICHTPDSKLSPNEVHAIVGDRLRENGRYRDIVEPLKRGWRINYANEFHLDITPAKDNHYCVNKGVLVTDKKLQSWKPSNPKGYAEWFENIAILEPSYSFKESRFLAKSGDIEKLPEQTPLKGVLRRTIQIMKRHRDLYFEHKGSHEKECAPISIIITTLATKSYEQQVTHGSYNNDFDLLMDVIKLMPKFIEKHLTPFDFHYQIMNPTTTNENFAEKWNDHSERAQWFYQWHDAVVSDLERFGLNFTGGLDVMSKSLSTVLGEDTTSKALNTYNNLVSDSRNSALFILPFSGNISTDTGISVRRNTFFGN